ncbi:hypothetical protein PG911_08830 [Tenacibaculum ovolyticum]|uniref:hypothetical protein n=1 Tax=Tenacibaculum ovolyticum TaxID=104270 RepID=UPI0022F39B93|nr:hypothetical protein [Tenacibaculum ovolyticum]WBX78350.1 hypothetical protein PG911_08830 [Tenacibaculum ovolyticum]
MKFKFSQKDAIDSTITGVAAIGGATASKGIMGIVPEGAKKPIVRAGISLLTLAIASGIQGKDTLAQVSKGALLGVSVEQGLTSVSKLVAPSVKDAPTTQGEKFIAAIAGGMNGGDEDMYHPTLNIPQYDWNSNDVFEEVGGTAKSKLLTSDFKA